MKPNDKFGFHLLAIGVLSVAKATIAVGLIVFGASAQASVTWDIVGTDSQGIEPSLIGVLTTPDLPINCIDTPAICGVSGTLTLAAGTLGGPGMTIDLAVDPSAVWIVISSPPTPQDIFNLDGVDIGSYRCGRATGSKLGCLNLVTFTEATFDLVLTEYEFVDTDGDGDPDITDPDDDNDGIRDELDRQPLLESNNCTTNNGTNATLVGATISAQQTTCASKESVDVSGISNVGIDGDLRLISEKVSLTDTSVTDNGRLEVINADPCEGCPPPPPTVFVTSTNYGSALGGLAGGDAICQSRATAATLPGNWVAWLSVTGIHAISRIADTVYTKVDGTVVANSKADLTDGNIQSAINVDEFGNTATEVVWTGTTASGRGTEFDCFGWELWIGGLKATTGISTRTGPGWTDATSERSCSASGALYCFPALPDE